MRVYRSIAGIAAADRGAVLAIGNFDGVHRGHQALLRAAVDAARARDKPAGVLLFDPHPREFFQPNQSFFTLTPMPLRLRLLARLGLDFALVLPFDGELAGLTAQGFVDRILVGGLGIAEAVVGYDFNYGRDRHGSTETLGISGRHHGFAVTVVPPTRAAPDQPVFSSSGIRAALKLGDMAEVARHLGCWWRLSGTVIGGAKRGTGLGFPTANIAILPGQDFKHGIYAAYVWVGQQRYDAASYFGTRPTFDGGQPLLETFLLDFDGDLYGQTIDVELIEFLRGDGAFTTIDALRVQMQRDCDAARSVLARLAEHDMHPAAGYLPP